MGIKQLITTGSLFVLFFSSCDNNENPQETYHTGSLVNNRITISDIKFIPEGVDIDKVKVEVAGVDWQIITTIEALNNNGEFVLSLPSVFLRGELQKVVRDSAGDYAGYWPAVSSNSDARVAGFKDIFAFRDNKKVGRVFLTDWSDQAPLLNKAYIYYQYTDQPFTLSTASYYPYSTFAGSFKKGWNAYGGVNKTKENSSIGETFYTTLIPVEAALIWRFESAGH